MRRLFRRYRVGVRFGRRTWVLLAVLLILGRGAGAMVIVLLLLLCAVLVPATLALTYPKPRLARMLRRFGFSGRVPAPVQATADQPYCLILRTFGRDGDVVLPDLNVHDDPKRLRIYSPLVVPTMTSEQVVAVASSQRGLTTRAIADQQALFAPPQLHYDYATDAEWRQTARSLIRGAAAIAIFVQPTSNAKARRIVQRAHDGADPRLLISPGLRWEVDEIMRMGQAHHTVMVLPPSRPGTPAFRIAHRQAALILTLLTGDDLDESRLAKWESWFHSGVMFVCLDSRKAGYQWFAEDPPGVKNGELTVVTYLDCFAAALASIVRKERPAA